jgi:translation initiation factor 3 subunit L
MMNGGVSRLAHEDDSDDEVLATTLVEAMQEDEGDYDDVSVSGGIQVTGDDLQARLAAAATPLEFQAGLPARFQSYDNYCSLFHFILNSDGPVDLELPTVSLRRRGRGMGMCVCGGDEPTRGLTIAARIF